MTTTIIQTACQKIISGGQTGFDSGTLVAGPKKSEWNEGYEFAFQKVSKVIG